MSIETDKTEFQWKPFDLRTTGHIAKLGQSRGGMTLALASVARGQVDGDPGPTASAEAGGEPSKMTISNPDMSPAAQGYSRRSLSKWSTIFLAIMIGMFAGAWVSRNVLSQRTINPSIQETVNYGVMLRAVDTYRRAAERGLSSADQIELARDLHQAMGFGPVQYSTRPLWLAALIGPDTAAVATSAAATIDNQTSK